MTYTPIWNQRRDEILAIARRVASERPDLWAEAQIETPLRRYINAVAVACQRTLGDRTIGGVTLRAADVGCNEKRGHQGTSFDVLSFPNASGVRDAKGKFSGLEIVDIIARSGTPSAEILWTDVTQATIDGGADGGWNAPIDPGGATGGWTPPPPVVATKLGVSHFGGVGLYRRDLNRHKEFMSFFKNDLAPDYARIFWWLEGGPWGVVGTGHLSDADRRELMTTVIQELLAIHVKPQLTVFGSWVPDDGRRRDLIEQFKATARPFAQQVFLVDCYNEPGAIGVPEYGYVRECGRALAGEGYPLLSLASPNTLHMGVEVSPTERRDATDAEVYADTSKLYDGMPSQINAITPHWARTPWNPHRRMGPSAAGLHIINDEPRGYESSGSWITDPADFGADYTFSSLAREDYTFHGRPGIFHGYCDTSARPEWARHNNPARWQDVPRIGEILDALHGVQRGGTAQPKPGEPEMPLPDRGDMMAAINWLHDYYKSDAGLKRDKGLWKDDRPDSEGIGAWILDVYIVQRQKGKTDAEAKAEIIKQIEASEEWKGKHK